MSCTGWFTSSNPVLENNSFHGVWVPDIHANSDIFISPRAQAGRDFKDSRQLIIVGSIEGSVCKYSYSTEQYVFSYFYMDQDQDL